MIGKDDITVVLSAVLPSESHLWMMNVSCARFQIKPKLYGLGDVAGSWVDVLFDRLREAVVRVETSHVLYSDSRDAFFLTGLDEVADKYNRMGAPDMLFSAIPAVGSDACREYYKGIEWGGYLFRYLAVGGFLCERNKLLKAMDWILNNKHMWAGIPVDVPPLWCKFVEAHPAAIELDHFCDIFLNAGSVPLEIVEVRSNRIYVRMVDAFPCIIHFNGGYSDPQTGKWAQMQQYWRDLGYMENPPWTRNIPGSPGQ